MESISVITLVVQIIIMLTGVIGLCYQIFKKK